MFKILMQRASKAVLEQMQRGLSPSQAALATALGLWIGILPLLGLSMVLCLGLAWALRLNHGLIQAANWAAYPLQLMLMFPFFWAGARMFHHPGMALSPSVFFGMAASRPLELARTYWQVALDGTLVWMALGAAAVPLLWWILSFSYARLAALRGLAGEEP
jgi:uncharacterized protein (DUF2062 family)